MTKVKAPSALASRAAGPCRARLTLQSLGSAARIASDLQRFDDHLRLRQGYSSVSVRWMTARWPSGVRHPAASAAPPVSCMVGLPDRQVDDPHVAPEHAAPHARAERLGAGLLGRETFGVGRGARRSAIGFCRSISVKQRPAKRVAEACQHLFDAADVAKIDTEADDHSTSPVLGRARKLFLLGTPAVWRARRPSPRASGRWPREGRRRSPRRSGNARYSVRRSRRSGDMVSAVSISRDRGRHGIRGQDRRRRAAATLMRSNSCAARSLSPGSAHRTRRRCAARPPARQSNARPSTASSARLDEQRDAHARARPARP